jgi:hypothetical protein
MAKQTTTVLLDDIDGTAAENTVFFGLDNVNYEIDLSPDHERELRDALAHWVENARKVAAKGRGAGKAKNQSSDTNTIRAWAKSEGIDVNERGRISATVRKQYEEAHGLA